MPVPVQVGSALAAYNGAGTIQRLTLPAGVAVGDYFVGYIIWGGPGGGAGVYPTMSGATAYGGGQITTPTDGLSGAFSMLVKVLTSTDVSNGYVDLTQSITGRAVYSVWRNVAGVEGANGNVTYVNNGAYVPNQTATASWTTPASGAAGSSGTARRALLGSGIAYGISNGIGVDTTQTVPGGLTVLAASLGAYAAGAQYIPGGVMYTTTVGLGSSLSGQSISQTGPEGGRNMPLGSTVVLLVGTNAAPDVPTALAPTGLLTTFKPTLTATVTDSDGDPAYAYFQVATDAGFTNVVFQGQGSTVASGGTSSLLTTGLAPSTLYYVRAYASDGSLSSAYSASSTFTTAANGFSMMI